QNPQHTYNNAGTFTVNLTVTNAGGSATKIRTDYITVTEESGINDFITENVFIYGNQLYFEGDLINGPGATVLINGGLDTSNINWMYKEISSMAQVPHDLTTVYSIPRISIKVCLLLSQKTIQSVT